MRALQYFPTIEDPDTRRSLFEVCSPAKYSSLTESISPFSIQLHLSKRISSKFQRCSGFHYDQSGFATDIDGNRCGEKCEQKQCVTCCPL